MSKKLQLTIVEAIELYYSLDSSAIRAKEKLRFFLLKNGVELK